MSVWSLQIKCFGFTLSMCICVSVCVSWPTPVGAAPLFGRLLLLPLMTSAPRPPTEPGRTPLSAGC